jgi:hypothetical protein
MRWPRRPRVAGVRVESDAVSGCSAPRRGYIHARRWGANRLRFTMTRRLSAACAMAIAATGDSARSGSTNATSPNSCSNSMTGSAESPPTGTRSGAICSRGRAFERRPHLRFCSAPLRGGCPRDERPHGMMCLMSSVGTRRPRERDRAAEGAPSQRPTVSGACATDRSRQEAG